MTWRLRIRSRLTAVSEEPVFGWTCLGLVVGPSVLLFLLASAPGGTFTGAVPTGATAPSILVRTARVFGFNDLGPPRSSELAYALITLACVGFVGVLLASRHGGISTRAVVGWSVALIAFASVGPPLFSHDLYGYAVYSRLLVFHHANPYVQTPSVAPHDPLYPYNPWSHLRSVYGPAFTDLSAVLVWAFRSAAGSVAAFKVLSGVCWAATVILAARLAHRQGPTQACFAAAVIGLNPVVLFRTAAGGHADALVALLFVAALTMWYDARPLLVTVFLTTAMLVKVVAAIPFLIFLVASIHSVPTTSDRIKALGKHLAIVVTLSLVALAPFGYTPRVVSAILSESSYSGGSLRPPEVMVSARVASILRHVGLSHHVALSNRVIETVFLALAALAFLVLVRPGDPRPVPERVLLALMIFVLCSPWLQPWYLAWFIPFIGFVTRKTLIAVAVGLSVIASESLVTQMTSNTVLRTLSRFSYDIYPILDLALLIVLLVAVVRPLRRTLLTRTSGASHEPVLDYTDAS